MATLLQKLNEYSNGATLHSADKLKIGVTVSDIREVWGRTDLLVSPVAGSGSVWVSADRVTIAQ